MRKSGFTLIEMIAVLLILALLAAAITAGLATARDKAWRTQARELCRELCTAWNAYLLDARKFPKDIPNKGKALDAKYDNIKWIVNPDENRASRIYFEITEAEKDDGLRDHWKQYISFSLDTDYDGIVKNPYPAVFDPPKEEIKASSIAWSKGNPKRAKRDDNPIVIW